MLGTLVLVVVDCEARLHNQARLRSLSRDRSKGMRLFCSHDAIQFKAFADQSSDSQNLEFHHS
jgi:hypothetical protein